VALLLLLDTFVLVRLAGLAVLGRRRTFPEEDEGERESVPSVVHDVVRRRTSFRKVFPYFVATKNNEEVLIDFRIAGRRPSIRQL